MAQMSYSFIIVMQVYIYVKRYGLVNSMASSVCVCVIFGNMCVGAIDVRNVCDIIHEADWRDSVHCFVADTPITYDPRVSVDTTLAWQKALIIWTNLLLDIFIFHS